MVYTNIFFVWYIVMAPIEPGTAAYNALSTERLRAEKHRVINALEKQKLNPVYAHVQRDITQAQSTLQNMSVETQGTEVERIVQEAQRRQLVEGYSDGISTTGNWTVLLICILICLVLGYVWWR